MPTARWTRIALSGALAGAVLLTAPEFPTWTSRQPAVQAAESASEALTATIALKLKARSPSFEVKTSGSASASLRTVDQAFEAAMQQDDYTKYTIKSYSYSSKSDGKKAAVTVKVNYWENASQSAYVASRSRQILAQVLTTGMNDHQKVKAIHDWVLLHVKYDQTLRKHSAYDALVSGQAVCQGYASLTYRLLSDAGIAARIVEGEVKSGAHAWNLVKLDGKWYHLDTTFDDPVPDVSGRTEYGYYLIDDDRIKRDHSWTLSYPAASASYADALKALEKTDASRSAFYSDLYEALGYSYLSPERTARNAADISAAIQKAARSGETEVKLRFAGGANQKLDLKALLDRTPGIDSLRVVTSAFPAGEPNDALLDITFTLSS